MLRRDVALVVLLVLVTLDEVVEVQLVVGIDGLDVQHLHQLRAEPVAALAVGSEVDDAVRVLLYMVVGIGMTYLVVHDRNAMLVRHVKTLKLHAALRVILP